MVTILYAIIAVLLAGASSFFVGRQKGKKSANIENDLKRKTEEAEESKKQEIVKNEVIETSKEINDKINSSSGDSIANELRRKYSRD